MKWRKENRNEDGDSPLQCMFCIGRYKSNQKRIHAVSYYNVDDFFILLLPTWIKICYFVVMTWIHKLLNADATRILLSCVTLREDLGYFSNVPLQYIHENLFVQTTPQSNFIICILVSILHHYCPHFFSFFVAATAKR